MVGNLISSFMPISLQEMEKVRLMNRMDTKYTTHPERLYQLLKQMQPEYFVQEIQGNRISPYQTLYLDTPDLHMYRIHQTGRRTREKIRMREYQDSHLTFLEIKDKNNKGRTSKIRIPLPEIEYKLGAKAGEFIRKHAKYNPEELIPHLRNQFDRITLVNKAMTERLTIDPGISFYNVKTGFSYQLPHLIIIELKQDGNFPSPAKNLLAGLHIRPVSISKYCLGCILTVPSLKYNRFKSRLRQISKQTNTPIVWSH